MMRWVLWGLGAMVVLGGVVWVVGSLLPVAHSATVSRIVEGEPEEVWTVMTDVERFLEWRTGLTGVERLPDREGRPVWRERSSHGAMTMEVSRWQPPTSMVTRIADEGLPFGGTWTYDLEPTAGGTRVTLTEDGEIYNPLFRFMARFVFGYEGTMNGYLDGLEARMAGGMP